MARSQLWAAVPADAKILTWMVDLVPAAPLQAVEIFDQVAKGFNRDLLPNLTLEKVPLPRALDMMEAMARDRLLPGVPAAAAAEPAPKGCLQTAPKAAMAVPEGPPGLPVKRCTTPVAVQEQMKEWMAAPVLAASVAAVMAEPIGTVFPAGMAMAAAAALLPLSTPTEFHAMAVKAAMAS